MIIGMEVRKSKIHGRGVFATQAISMGYEFYNDVILVDGKELEKYQYPWIVGKTGCICIGIGSFFNHSVSKPNVKVIRIDPKKLRKYFVTTKNIRKGEELLINYGNTKTFDG